MTDASSDFQRSGVVKLSRSQDKTTSMVERILLLLMSQKRAGRRPRKMLRQITMRECRGMSQRAEMRRERMERPRRLGTISW